MILLTNGFVDKEGCISTEEGGDSLVFCEGEGGGTGLGAGRRGCSGMSGATELDVESAWGV